MQRNLGKTSADDMEIVSLQPESSVHSFPSCSLNLLFQAAGTWGLMRKEQNILSGDVDSLLSLTLIPRCRWFRLCHPGGPGCKTNKDFRAPGYDFKRNYQCEIQLTIQESRRRQCDICLTFVQIMPRAKARAIPASLGFKAGPAKLQDP